VFEVKHYSLVYSHDFVAVEKLDSGNITTLQALTKLTAEVKRRGVSRFFEWYS